MAYPWSRFTFPPEAPNASSYGSGTSSERVRSPLDDRGNGAEHHVIANLRHELEGFKQRHRNQSILHRQLEHKYEDVAGAHKTLKSDYEVLEQQHAAVMEENEVLQENYDAAKEDCNALQEKHDNAVVEYEELQETHEAIVVEYEELKEQHADSVLHYVQLKETLDTSLGRHAKLTEDNDRMTLEMERLGAEQNQVHATNKQLEDKIEDLKNKVAEKESVNEDLQDRVAGLDFNVKDLQDSNVSLLVDADKLRAVLKRSEEKHAEAVAKSEALAVSREESEKSEQEANIKIENLTNEVSGLQSDIAGWREKTDTAKAIVAKHAMDTKTKIADINSELTLKKNEHSSALARIAAFESEVAAMTQTAERNEHNIATLEHANQLLRNDYHRMESRLAEKDTRISELDTTLSLKDATIEKVKTDLATALAAALKKAKCAEEVSVTLFGDTNKMRATIDYERTVIDDLKLKLDAKAAQEKDIADLNAQLRRKNEDITELECEKKDLQKALVNSHKSYNKKSAELDKTFDALNKLQIANTDKDKSIRDLTDKNRERSETITRHTRTIASMQKAFATLDSHSKMQATRITQLGVQASKKDTRIQNLRDEIDFFRENLTRKSKAVEQLTGGNAAKDATIKELKAKLSAEEDREWDVIAEDDMIAEDGLVPDDMVSEDETEVVE